MNEPLYPEHLDKRALMATVVAAGVPGPQGARRTALFGSLRTAALQRTADPGWALVAGFSDEEMAQVLGSHVETLPAAVQKLREGGAKPDRRPGTQG